MMKANQRVEHKTYGLGVIQKNGNDRAWVRFDNETEDRCILLTYLSNSDQPLVKPPSKPASIKKELAQYDTTSLIGHIKSVGCIITVEAPKSHHDTVRQQYLEATGEEVPHNSSHLIEVNNRPIIPIEWRCTFVAPPNDPVFDYPHDDVKKKTCWRINRKAFVFELFSAGFRLGVN